MFAAVYINDGYFRLRVFTEVERETEEEIERDELDINKALGIDNYTIPIDNFPDPYITCCFCTSSFIYVNLYHNYTTTHHSFVYNIKTREVTSHLKIFMNSNDLNFPYRCFFSTETVEVYSFYR